MVQKKALAIILANNYTTYESALLSIKLELLDVRQTSHSFALKCTKSHRNKHTFPPSHPTPHKALSIATPSHTWNTSARPGDTTVHSFSNSMSSY